eukprot:403373698
MSKNSSNTKNQDLKSPLIINNQNTTDSPRRPHDMPTTQRVMCLPDTYKKSPTKEGDEFRFYVQIALILHLLFALTSLFSITFSLMLRQVLYLYLTYYIYMTLSRLATVVYVIIAGLGVMWGSLDMFGASVEGAREFFLYVLVNMVSGYMVYIIARKMMKYTYSLSDKNKRLIQNQDEENTTSGVVVDGVPVGNAQDGEQQMINGLKKEMQKAIDVEMQKQIGKQVDSAMKNMVNITKKQLDK